jgi:hypothetical protein
VVDGYAYGLQVVRKCECECGRSVSVSAAAGAGAGAKGVGAGTRGCRYGCWCLEVRVRLKCGLSVRLRSWAQMVDVSLDG